VKVTRDDHHLFHERVRWEQYQAGKTIRESTLARGLGRSAHELLHAETAAVPVPSYHSLIRIASEMDKHYENPLEGIDDYTRAVDMANKYPRAKDIEKEVNNLSVRALRAQIPYLKELLPKNVRVL
jgi:hypothetical protein